MKCRQASSSKLYLCIVAFLSLEKIRMSEFVVAL